MGITQGPGVGRPEGVLARSAPEEKSPYPQVHIQLYVTVAGDQEQIDEAAKRLGTALRTIGNRKQKES